MGAYPSPPAFAALFLELKERENLLPLQVVASPQRGEFREEATFYNIGPEPVQQPDDRGDGPARRQHIVRYDDLHPGTDGVLVDLEAILPVFEVIGGRHRLV